MKLIFQTPLLSAFSLVLFVGCATFRSDLHGAYKGSVDKNPSSKPVSVLFHFTLVEQEMGYDAIPKVVGKMSMIRSFDDVFHDASRELTNLGKYTTFTEEASDVNHPERRATRDSLIGLYDYTMRIRFVKEKRFIPQFFAGFAMTITATIVPVPFHQWYRMESDVYARDGKLVGTYKREVNLAKWVELFLVFAYPFYPEDRKREEAMLIMFHDTFKQIDVEKVLVNR